MPALSKGPDTIVLVHGFWVTPRSWEHWITRYEARGYRVLRESVSITFSDNQAVWRFGVVALERFRAVSPTHVAEELSKDASIASFSITPVRY